MVQSASLSGNYCFKVDKFDLRGLLILFNILHYGNLPNNTLKVIGTPQVWMQISLLHNGTRRHVRDPTNTVFKVRKQEKNKPKQHNPVIATSAMEPYGL